MALDDPHAEAGVTMTHARKLCGGTPPVGASEGGLIPPGDVKRVNSRLCELRIDYLKKDG